MSYLDRKTDRVLLRNGISIMTEWGYAKQLVRNNELPASVKVEKSESTDTYRLIYGEELGYDVSLFEEPEPKERDDTALDFLSEDEGLVQERLALLLEAHGDLVMERLESELDYFEKIGAIPMINRTNKLLKSFREDGVVWGVGRGSVCASLILFLIGAHDIDPIQYDIPFSELSKETESKYE